MAESPVKKLARLVGGVAMLPGSVGHQALGQLLISGSKAVEVAAANVALAAAFRQTNAAIQIAAGSIVPAVVFEALDRKKERRFAEERQRLERLSEEIAQQPNAVDQIALRSMVPAVVVEALIRNGQRRLEEEQLRHEMERYQQQRDLKALSDEALGERERIMNLGHELERNERRHDEAWRQQRQDLEALRDEVRGERMRMMDLCHELEKRQPLHEALSKEVFELRSQNERLQCEMKDLQGRLDDYAAERVAGAPNLRRNTQPPDATPEMTPATGPKEPSVSTKPAADTSSELAARNSKNAETTTKRKVVTAKKGRPPS